MHPEYYSATKMRWSLLFVVKWTEPEEVTVTATHQAPAVLSHMWKLRNNVLKWLLKIGKAVWMHMGRKEMGYGI